MDTTVQINAFGAQTPELQTAVSKAFSYFQTIADQTNRYEDASPHGLYQLNAHAGQGFFPVDRHVFRLAQFAQEQPFPDFEITLGPVIDLWRQHGITKTVPSETELQTALALTGKNKMELTFEGDSLALATGSSLDLGAIAKGYAVDGAAAVLAQNQNVTAALINAGGNIKAIGTKTDGKPWRIALQDPRQPQANLGVFLIQDGEALATSGDYQRYYEVDGKRYHHLLNPQDGLPARHTISVTIVNKSALMADYYSTLLFVLPPTAAIALAAERQLDIVLVTAQKTVYISPALRPRFESNLQGDYTYAQE
ncbi:MAG: FAD:protein FMN transferase [Acidaminococcaceae bacterium]